ncbi:intestinal mucin-like protein [Discoglossus pictus]
MSPRPTSSPFTSPGSPTPYISTSSSTTCYCKVNNALFSPGEIIYKTADSDGCEYYAKCNDLCKPERYLGQCTTTSPTTTSPSVVTSTENTISSTQSTSLTLLSSPPPTAINETTTPSCGICECQMPKCGSGFRVATFLPRGACCANITCVPESVCVVGNEVYQRGSIIPQPKDSCQTCSCSYDMDHKSDFYAVKCQPIVCETTCQKGYVYRQRTGTCCGECVAKQCNMMGANNKEIDIQVGDIYHPPGSTCAYYECAEEDGQPILTKVKKVCQNLDIARCDMSTLRYDEDGCCQTCTYKQVGEPKIIEDCSARKNVTVLRVDNCELEVELTYCGGPCMGSSMYSMQMQNMRHQCTCCTEMEVQDKTVQLICANGQYKSHTYPDVVSCGCVGALCTPNNSL